MLDRVGQQGALGLQGGQRCSGKSAISASSSARRRRATWYCPAPKARISSRASSTRSSHAGVGYTSRITPVPSVTTPTERCLAAAYRRRSSIRSSACTAVVGSLTAGESALMATSTIIRMVNAGSSRSVRSSPIASALRSCLPGIARDPYTLSSAPAPGTWSPTACTSSITASWLSARCTRRDRSSATSTDPTGELSHGLDGRPAAQRPRGLAPRLRPVRRSRGTRCRTRRARRRPGSAARAPPAGYRRCG